LQIKREDLANLVGTTRETVTRILYELQHQEIIELSSKKIKILQLDKLKKQAHKF
jgi:CRP/FNR family transcriptional regulator